jgi:hypothetical protein
MDIAWLLGRISPILFFQPSAVNAHRSADAAARILARDEVAYARVRSALNNGYQCRIDRASRPQAAGIRDPLQA